MHERIMVGTSANYQMVQLAYICYEVLNAKMTKYDYVPQCLQSPILCPFTKATAVTWTNFPAPFIRSSKVGTEPKLPSARTQFYVSKQVRWTATEYPNQFAPFMYFCQKQNLCDYRLVIKMGRSPEDNQTFIVTQQIQIQIDWLF